MNLNNLEGTLLIVVIFAALVGILVAVLYLLTLQNTLKEVSENNREVPPTNVWLMFIPLFNIIYPFILYPKICDSVKNEYNERGLEAKGDFSRNIGITMPILGLCSMIPFIGSLASLGNLVLFIIFWVKMSEYKNELIRTKGMTGKAASISNNPDLLD